jgi:toxin ParE1/3/4
VKKFKVEITRSAESDLAEIFHYIAADNRPNAIRFISEIELQIGTLSRFPLRCPIVPEALDIEREYRHLLYGNYRTIFRVASSRVIILRIIHAARLLDLSVFEKHE